MPSLPMVMIEPVVRAALLEDLGRAGDLTTDSIVPADALTRTALVARQPGVVAGLDFAAAAFRLIDPAIAVDVALPDGNRLRQGDLIATISGPARGILTAERTALNFLCHLSGVASAPDFEGYRHPTSAWGWGTSRWIFPIPCRVCSRLRRRPR